jgi:hypothetical protein
LLHTSLPEGCAGSGCLNELLGTAAGEGPLLVASGLLFATAAATLVVLARRRRPLGKVGVAAIVCAAVALGFGAAAAVSITVDDDAPWTPLLVLPALALFVTAGILIAVLVLRARLIPTWLATALIATAALLLFYNEQTALVLLAIPFASVCVILGLNPVHRRVESSPAIGSVDVAR